jgi:hypothetical protein
MECKFCSKLCKNDNSLRNHERLCRANPNRQILKSNFIEYHKKIKLGLVTKIATNQFTKAKLEGKDWIIADSTRDKLSKSNIGRKHSVKTKEKLSKRRSAILEEIGGGGFTHIKYYETCNVLNEIYKVRGLWELNTAMWLTQQSILWKRKIYISYIDEQGVTRTYTPDFYLPKYNVYIEVKGYFSEKDKNKLEKVVSQNKIDLYMFRKPQIDLLSTTNNIFDLLTYKM